MLTETGRVVDIREDSLWVETIKSSTCGACVAEKGCGQTVLKRLGAKPTYLRIPLAGHSKEYYQLNDVVTIGIPDDIVVKGSLFLYLLPLVFLLVFSGIAHTYYYSDILSMLSGLVGFCVGCILIRWHSYYYRDDQRHHAFLVENQLLQKVDVS